MAHAGVASRRECEKIIEQRRVTVNGKVASLGEKADPARDDIRVDGARLTVPTTCDYIMLHKPKDVISDEDVGGNWPAAREMIPLEGRLYPVGRLDLKSEGLMLFTNDGDLAHRLTHPRYDHTKTYHVTVAGSPDERTLDSWRRGIMLEGEKTRAAAVRVLRKQRDATELEIVMKEGKKRQIRRVAAILGHPVTRLVRVGLGPLQLGDLAPGAWRRLTDAEVNELKSIRQEQRPPRRQGKGGSKKGKKRAGQAPKSGRQHP